MFLLPKSVFSSSFQTWTCQASHWWWGSLLIATFRCHRCCLSSFRRKTCALAACTHVCMTSGRSARPLHARCWRQGTKRCVGTAQEMTLLHACDQILQHQQQLFCTMIAWLGHVTAPISRVGQQLLRVIGPFLGRSD